MRSITESLASIAGDWPQLLADAHAIPALAGSGMPGGGGITLPGGSTRLSLIAETRHTLWHWCAIVLAERSGDVVLHRRVHVEDVVAMCAWLAPHADWIAERNAISLARHEQGEDAVAELDDLAATMHAVIEPARALRPPIGPCQVADCDGTIRGYIDTACPEAADLVCDTVTEHRWERGRWVDLARALGEDEAEWLSTEAMAAYLAARFRRPVRPDLIRKWTLRHGIGIWRGPDGRWDRIAVTRWYLGWSTQRVGA